MIAIAILRSMAYAFERWEALGAVSGYPIPEEHWHVTDYYKSIREKATEVPGCFGDIWKIGQKRHLEEIGGEGGEDAVAAVGADGRKLDDLGFWPGRICNIPMQGQSLWGPRYDPMRSSLLTIMKPNVFGDVDPSIKSVPTPRSASSLDGPPRRIGAVRSVDRTKAFFDLGGGMR
jgi:hypothetical protein